MSTEPKLTEEDRQQVQRLVSSHNKPYTVELTTDGSVVVKENGKEVIIVGKWTAGASYQKWSDNQLARDIDQAIHPPDPSGITSGTTTVRTEYEKMMERKGGGSNPFEGGMGKSKSQGGKG